jgi:hypothetical protein
MARLRGRAPKGSRILTLHVAISPCTYGWS